MDRQMASFVPTPILRKWCSVRGAFSRETLRAPWNLKPWEDVYRFALGLRNASGKSRFAMKPNCIKEIFVGRFATVWVILIYLSLFISGNRALGQEHFVKSLQENEHLWHPNVKEIGCESQFNKQPHGPDAAVFVKCSIIFADQSPDFGATLRFCPNFQTCDAAGGKFKDIVIGILRKRIADKLPLGAKK
jgi:hypothetical protein